MKILFLESFFGGSHKDFACDLEDFSSHQITLLTLPARHWKWRQAGSALAFMDQMKERKLFFSDFDGLIITGLIDLNLLKSLVSLPPVLLYLHETQFHYPLGQGEKVDFHYGFKDITNMLAADRIIFNSHYHGNTFFKEAENFLCRMPQGKPQQWLESIKYDWQVIYPGFKGFGWNENLPEEINSDPPVILWNHRWEHDKNPQDFYRFLKSLSMAGKKFKLILLGERFSKYPAVFDNILDEFSKQILYRNYAQSRKEYEQLLSNSDYVISTSQQENFGISIVEAIAAGCLPLLPNRLSYGEILEEEFHDFLYKNEQEMVDLYMKLCQCPPSGKRRKDLINSMGKFDRQKQIKKLDKIFDELIKKKG